MFKKLLRRIAIKLHQSAILNCEHPGDGAKADILEGGASDFAIQWCERCGSWQWCKKHSDGSVSTVGEWRKPMPVWYL